MSTWFVGSVTVALVTLATDGGPQSLPSKALAAPEVFAKAEVVRSMASWGARTYVVQGRGTRVFPDPVLAAEQIVFEPGSRLEFESGGGFGGDRGERYIAARTIRVLPGTPPPIITWRRGGDSSFLPLPVGKAAPGPIGAREGADGGRGDTGQIGNPGYPGRSAPTLYMFVGQVVGGPLLVDLQGMDGQVGGVGQIGGDGGIGGTGSASVASPFDCRSAGGNGGRGGQGGAGGQGGTGGRGGNGGQLVIVSTEPGLKVALAALTVKVDPGRGGPGGSGGHGGEGGPGGQGGSGSGFCKGGEPGPTGEAGPSGPPGETGPDGAPGVLASTIFTAQQLNKALGSSQSK